MPHETDDTQAWQEWITTACRVTGTDPGQVDVDQILGLAGQVARQVARPMVPVTAFIAGLAVGSGADLTTTLKTLVAAADSVARQQVSEQKAEATDAGNTD